MMQSIATRTYTVGSNNQVCSSSKKDTCLVTDINRTCSDSSGVSLCSTSVSSNASATGSGFFSSPPKRVDTAPTKPQHQMMSPSGTSTNKGNNKKAKNLLSMIDQMLDQHDRYDSDSDNDDNRSCSSIASYHSLSFGDDGKGFYDSDDDTLSTSSGSSFTSDDSNDDDALDETSYFDEDDVEGDDDDDDCSISTCGSRHTMGADSLVFDLKNVSSSSSLTSLRRRGRKSNAAQRRHVQFNENVRVKPIRHVNDMSDAEIQRLYMNSEEAYEIRMECLDMVQLMEEQEENEGAQVLDKYYCTRGLEKHTARNNEALMQQRELLYASVLKIQSLCLPPGMMDMEATIAEICTKLTEPSVVKALKYGVHDAKEAGTSICID